MQSVCALRSSIACSRPVLNCASRQPALRARSQAPFESKPDCARAPLRHTVRVNAAADAYAQSQEPSPSSSGGLSTTLLLGGMFGAWYAFNIVFNIYNKQVLNVFFYPLTCTAYQFFLGGLIGLGWMVATGRKVDTSPKILKAVFPLAVVHTLGNLLTNCSLGMVAVSFTHTIKAMEPFFSVVLSYLFLGESQNPWVLLTLLPIVGGVAIASVTELTFNWLGFGAAMGSNITFQSRNVLSKKVMTPDIKEQLGGSIGLFSMITMLSFAILAPIALIRDGWIFNPTAMRAMGIANPNEILTAATAAALTFHAYQQVSYMILSRVSPVTHSIGNCVKRVIVIVASVIVFKNPVTPVNATGTGLALLGVFAYSQVKKATSKKKAA